MNKNHSGYIYEKTLFYLLSNSTRMNPTEFDGVWIQKYKEVHDSSLNVNNLPIALALIHPNFYYRRGEPFHNNLQLQWLKNNNFKNGILRTNRCQFVKCSGYDCVFHESRIFNIEADHFWPNSLGGPSILSNRLLLCSFHNNSKSNSYLNYNWNEVPSWLLTQLEVIYYLKR